MGKASFDPPRDNVIRSRLLNRLGIYKSKPSARERKQVIHALSSSSSSTNVTSPIRIGTVVRQPLKNNMEDLSSVSRMIHFDETVLVVCIPSRHEYSSRMKKVFWRDGQAITECAQQRNRTEGWDWHTVVEDDDMYMGSITGEFTHPRWFDEFDQESLDDEEDYLDIEAPGIKRSQACMLLQELEPSNQGRG